MRRSDREITDKKEMIEIIKKCDVCRIVLNDEDYPYIVPLNFGMDIQDEGIVFYFHGATEGKKYDLIRKNNKATFEMDCSHQLVMDDKKMSCTMKYESIIGRGHIEIVSEEEKMKGLEILMKQYHQEDFQFGTAIVPNTNVFKLTVEEMTGKRR
ncbi:MAG: pyridoxamine 5'-phosphate oxidase family protein [Eubacterium sp.]|nr:pyridoxamine 5'-phosphate oxidase family protein [Eubacterium sp.]